MVAIPTAVPRPAAAENRTDGVDVNPPPLLVRVTFLTPSLTIPVYADAVLPIPVKVRSKLNPVSIVISSISSIPVSITSSPILNSEQVNS